MAAVFDDFFSQLTDKDTLLFTTFSLDEAVLLALLNAQKVPGQQSIVVYHDILRHRNPGLVKAHFPNAVVYSVELIQQVANRCPVFHSKIWARIQQGTITRLLISSANLSQYHLVAQNDGGTLESTHSIGQCAIKSASCGWLFDKALLNPAPAVLKRGLQRLRLPPYQLVLDCRGDLQFTATNQPLIGLLQSLGVPNWCAAPFVCDSAIRTYLGATDKCLVYQGTNARTGMELHAKAMGFDAAVTLGSVNWTAQAMGSLGHVINHETLLIAPPNRALLTALRDFPKRPLGNLTCEVPGDQDIDELMTEDWLAERQARIDAPEQALLHLGSTGAVIKLVGTFKPITSVQLHNFDSTQSMTVVLAGSMLSEPKQPREQQLFAQIIASGRVLMRGLNGANGDQVWKLELDYQQYWPTLEELRAAILANNAGIQPHSLDKLASFQFQDVRNIRHHLLRQPDKARHLATFNRWLCDRGVRNIRIPQWCVTLAEQLREGQSA